MARNKISKLNRDKVLNMFNKKCASCGELLNFYNFEIDHIVPHCSSKDNSLNNLLPSCRDCNSIKGVFNIEEFRNYLQENKNKKYKVVKTSDFYKNQINGIVFYFETQKGKCE